MKPGAYNAEDFLLMLTAEMRSMGITVDLEELSKAEVPIKTCHTAFGPLVFIEYPQYTDDNNYEEQHDNEGDGR